jgi:hypothetical protein
MRSLNCIFVILLCLELNAQTSNEAIINNAGSNFNGNGYSIVSSLGEDFVCFDSLNAFCGFLKPDTISVLTLVNEMNNSVFNIRIYPVPFDVQFTVVSEKKLTNIIMFNLSGEEVNLRRVNNTFYPEQTVSLPVGTYFLVLTDENGFKYKTQIVHLKH